MNWGHSPATESRVALGAGPEQGPPRWIAPQGDSGEGTDGKVPPGEVQPIRIGKRASAEGNGPAEVFTMTLGGETIELLPFRNWGQLNLYKWSVQGKLPGTPAGLEVTPEHIKVAGETVSTGDPEGPDKLGKIFNEWLNLETKSLELARKRTNARPVSSLTSSAERARHEPLRFRVELDKRGQVHIHCSQGAETVGSVGLSVAGINGLATQGLMRKPRALEVGALHDWVELDGELCSFEHGNNDSVKLERLLNERYRPLGEGGRGKDILIFANAASPTGFDIQFPVTVGGVQENRRRTLNDAAIELLQEPVRCGLLQPGLILKISPPTLIIKRKTSDGGEAYLEKRPEHTVVLSGDDGGERLVNLSQPVNYTRLGVVELSAVLNHPVINRHSKIPSGAAKKIVESTELISAPRVVASEAPTAATAPVAGSMAEPDQKHIEHASPNSAANRAPADSAHSPIEPQPISTPAAAPGPLPNAWLKEALAQPPIRHDWLTCLIYREIAQHFGNSGEADLKVGRCWRVLLGGTSDVNDPSFRMLFLTQKSGLGFLGGGRLARFHRGVVFVGTEDSVLEGIDVHLVGVGLAGPAQIVFILRDEFRSKFGVPEQTIEQELAALNRAGALLLTVREVLEGVTALDTVWTVPAGQPDPIEPQAFKHSGLGNLDSLHLP